MKISTTVTVYDTVELEIKPPYYCKHEGKRFFVVDEDVLIVVQPRAGFTSITRTDPKTYAPEIASATVITADEWDAAYREAFTRIVVALQLLRKTIK